MTTRVEQGTRSVVCEGIDPSWRIKAMSCGPLALAALAGLATGAMATLASAQTDVRYAVVELGTPQGSSPLGMSDAGHITGLYFAQNGQRRPFLWDNGVVSDIAAFPANSQALDVNDHAVVVGYAVDVQDRQRAVKVQGGVLTDIGTLPGGIHAAAHDINNSGWIAGMSQRRQGNDMLQRAALWRNGTVIDLGTFGGEYSEANALNDAGQVVGWAWRPLPTRRTHAFLWSQATGLLDLGTLGGPTSNATDINEHGAVVGSSNPADSELHGFVWTAESGMIDLGVPEGGFDSRAAAINDAGQIVGVSFFLEGCIVQPLLWEDGQIHLLDDLIDPGSGWNLVQAFDINNRGEIAAIARRGAEPYRAVLLAPTGPAQDEAEAKPTIERKSAIPR